MNCPRCDKVMAEEQLEPEVRTLRCPQCQGRWVEGQDLRVLEQTVDMRVVEWRRLPSEELQVREIACPRCQPAAMLKKVKSERDRRVLLDVCERCQGVWLDKGELEAIQQMGLVAAIVDAVRFIART
ncbi:zf-TFIIB domain-containing protein [Hyalangium rubrum]|uniref:Zf-TFIIB domain-containing protein n=1 Tax=Hyalangium rubrum TaxID=3103134 RepID=A0ABU5GWN8_9BACT|nr:zf-TFIIB domain-containing protein [Hyalangium sp. s54d21]MDY7225604.1 zf-TFIIB domain-containing protein [Hyalangium sp. s54d21]